MTGAFTVLPAVDVAAGRAVRLVRGSAAGATVYGDPEEAAAGYRRQGASWIHLVDIDAAFDRGDNAELLAGLISRLDVPVQLSGGIRDEERLTGALSTGAARVVLSGAALTDLAWVRSAIDRAGDRLAVGLDVRGSGLVARGSTATGGDLLETLDALRQFGRPHYVVTDVTRDGTLAGPNLDLLRTVAAATDGPLLAGGGIGNLADLRAVAAVPGVAGAIVGGALTGGRFSLPEALAAVG